MKPPTRHGPCGYTSTELLIVVAIIGLVAFMACFHFRSQVPSHMLDRAGLRLTMDLRSARMRAISENVPVQVNVDRSHCTYMIWGDRNTNGTVDLGEAEAGELEAFPSMELQVNAPCGTFLPHGSFVSSNGYWEIRLSGNGVAPRFVSVMPNGQVGWTSETL